MANRRPQSQISPTTEKGSIDEEDANSTATIPVPNLDNYPVDVEHAKAEFEALSQKSLEDPDDDDFDLRSFLRSTSARNQEAGIKTKHIGVEWKDVQVIGSGGIKLHVRRFPDAVMEFFFSPMMIALNFLPKSWNPFMPAPKPILEGFTGLAKPGEMLVIALNISPSTAMFYILGSLLWNSSNATRARLCTIQKVTHSLPLRVNNFSDLKSLPSLDDVHYATLTVGQTLQFALSTKTPGKRLPNVSKSEFITQVRDLLLRMLNITHTKDTLVGNEFVRGVSGGERKRVSIAEMMATGACVLSYDNSTRGLDASTALDYAKSIRIMTDIFHMTTFVSIYQAGEGIYEQFDKVLVIDRGAPDARRYFVDMGFKDYPRQTTADYLTGCTDPNERQYQKGRSADDVPSTPAAMAEHYLDSPVFQAVKVDIELYRKQLADDYPVEEFQGGCIADQGQRQPQELFLYCLVPRPVPGYCPSPGSTSVPLQDRFALYTGLGTAVGIAIIIGTLFLNIPRTSAGAFTRGGALFISLLFNSFLAFSELPSQMMGRPILQKQVGYTLFRPAAYSLGGLVADMPFGAFQIMLFSMIVYLLCHLTRSASAFFTFYLFVLTTFFAMTTFFRLIGTVTQDYNVAARLAAFIVTAMVVYSGYLIPVFQMKRWLFWIYHINPVNYGFSALMENEFKRIDLSCEGGNIVPRNMDGLTQYGTTLGPNQVCTLAGSTPGSTIVTGAAYIRKAFTYSPGQQWRNFGILIVFFVGFQIMQMIAIEYTQSAVPPAIVIFEREDAEKKKLNERLMERKEAARRGELEQDLKGLIKTKKPFTWERLGYTVPVAGGQKKLLSEVYGYVLPGTLTALMGASGAGKTTLLDVLALRKTVGVITGDMLISGRPVGVDFQRGTAYCEQLDVHEMTATVREAMRFSAYLRQSYDIPQSEKDAYVEEIIELLELQDLADAMIGVPGFGLGVEARKRLTIGVELAAKPQLLLILGRADLWARRPVSVQCYRLLLLQRGGETVYFGDIGPDSRVLVDYFARNGAPCPPDANPAEFMLDAIGSGSRKRIGPKDWAEIYLDSPEFEENKRMIEKIKSDGLASNHEEEGPAVVRTEYATPWLYQLKIVTLRTFRSFWRQADYGFTRLFSHGIIALLVALTFLDLAHNVAALQFRVFVIFFASILPAIIIAQVEPMFIMGRQTFLREASSKMYSQPIFAIAQLAAEMPYSVLCGLVYYLLYYFPTKFNFSSSRAGGQTVAAITPTIPVAALLNPFLLVLFGLFCGVTITQPNLDPFTRLISGLIVTEMHDLKITCAPSEFYLFNPPSGQTCGEYASAFVTKAGGYINNLNATAQCQYCQFASGDEYYKPINISFGNRWRDLGIFVAFIGFNIFVTIVASKLFRFARR
ncbi:hypothetical protein BS47DRAFT_1363141 [Hydnum rufescens UP504]|uniref:ABC transporter domain-containing protein n=1 Tax=Hydnum rufescens UP504 TaxID=1448309 RepID=A0A9P6AV20_9AGAM|nr:hypothetical protein BS47DRAFT_1363141 [Hydnum rufescens UP504]